MKRMLLVLLTLMLAVNAALAEGPLTHFESVSAFTLDYPADLFSLVCDDSSTILRAPDDQVTAVISILCQDDQSAGPAEELAALAGEYGMEMTVDDIAVCPTAANGTAYLLRRVDEGDTYDCYIIQEGDRRFFVDAILSANAAERYGEAMQAVVLSIAVNSDMPYEGAIEPDEEWELDFYDAMIESYAPVLNLYGQAVSEGWDMDKLLEHDLCPLLALMGDPAMLEEQVCFDFVDLEGKGCYSMIVYMNAVSEDDGIDVLGIYTGNGDGSITTDVLSAERSLYTLCGSVDEGYTVACSASSSAFQSGDFFYRRENGGLKLIEAVMFDASVSEEKPWFRAVDEDWDSSNDTPITEAEAHEILGRYKPVHELDGGMHLGDYMNLFMNADPVQ